MGFGIVVVEMMVLEVIVLLFKFIGVMLLVKVMVKCENILFEKIEVVLVSGVLCFGDLVMVLVMLIYGEVLM